jgi:hypothetical protein
MYDRMLIPLRCQARTAQGEWQVFTSEQTRQSTK